MSVKNYQLSDFRNEVKQRLNEASNDGLWSTSDLNTYINDAIFRVVLDSRVLRSDEAISVAANVAYYSFPSDMLTPEFIVGSTLWGDLRLFPSYLLSLDKQYGGMYQWEKDSSNSSQGFVPFSYNQFILWPPPSATTTITLHHVPVPATLVNDTDTTSMPLVHQKAVIPFATYLALLKSDPRKAQGYLKEYKQRKVSLLELSRHQDQSRPTVMEPGFGPGRGFDRSMANPSVRAYRNSRRYY